jgi:assimilatory nitrate reductase catalytic subunit
VRIEKAELPWRLIAARRGDVLALQAAVQPLLRACSYASIGFEGEDIIVVRAAHITAPVGWVEQLQLALDLPTGADALEYRDGRRGIVKRANWQDDALCGFLFAGDTGGAEALMANLVEGERWEGSRLTVFARKSAAPADRTICQCVQVKESRILKAIEQGAHVNQLKATLGCGTVCGSCVPELKRLCDTHKVARGAAS